MRMIAGSIIAFSGALLGAVFGVIETFGDPHHGGTFAAVGIAALILMLVGLSLAIYGEKQ
jgi:hypothetical protein